MRAHTSRTAAAQATRIASTAIQCIPYAAGGPANSGLVASKRFLPRAVVQPARARGAPRESPRLFSGELLNVRSDGIDIVVAQRLDGRRMLGVALDAGSDVALRHLPDVRVAG